eukprot:GDKJ01047237.1.p1 GENE.GDKJ01047237.1~~GDKJ01047237.1.p1  ORF type:complete len:732 (-),score=82.17 GDKJ01047237.1:70-2001(-)
MEMKTAKRTKHGVLCSELSFKMCSTHSVDDFHCLLESCEFRYLFNLISREELMYILISWYLADRIDLIDHVSDHKNLKTCCDRIYHTFQKVSLLSLCDKLIPVLAALGNIKMLEHLQSRLLSEGFEFYENHVSACLYHATIHRQFKVISWIALHFDLCRSDINGSVLHRLSWSTRENFLEAATENRTYVILDWWRKSTLTPSLNYLFEPPSFASFDFETKKSHEGELTSSPHDGESRNVFFLVKSSSSKWWREKGILPTERSARIECLCMWNRREGLIDMFGQDFSKMDDSEVYWFLLCCSKSGNLQLMEEFRQQQSSKCVPSFDHIRSAALENQLSVLIWWKQQLPALPSSSDYVVADVIDAVCRKGLNEVLDWWVDESGWRFEWTSKSMDGASEEGHVHVLDWWERRAASALTTIELKYSVESLNLACMNEKTRVLDWWFDRRDSLLESIRSQISVQSISLYESDSVLEWWSARRSFFEFEGAHVFFMTHCDVNHLRRIHKLGVRLINSDWDGLFAMYTLLNRWEELEWWDETEEVCESVKTALWRRVGLNLIEEEDVKGRREKLTGAIDDLEQKLKVEYLESQRQQNEFYFYEYTVIRSWFVLVFRSWVAAAERGEAKSTESNLKQISTPVEDDVCSLFY